MNKILTIIKKNSPTILSVLACVGVAATTYLTAKAVPKASDRKWAALIKKDPQNNTYYYDNEPAVEAEVYPELTKKEMFLAVAPAYIPAAISCLATMACILGANVLNKKAQASLMSAYMLTNQHFNEYRKAAKEVYGEDADRKIKEQISVDNFNEDFMVYPSLTYHTDDSEANRVLFYEPYTEKYFWSTVERVQQAEYHANRALQQQGGLSIGQFFEFLGLTVEDDVLYITGWSMDWMLTNTGCNWLDFYNVYKQDSDKVDEAGKDIPPYFVIEYQFDPILNYEDWDWNSAPF